jgi:hypothetical protein
MKHDCFKIPLIVLAAVLFLFSMSTVCIAGGSFTFKWGKDKEPENNQVKHTYKHKKKGGPPSHAPAHGYRAKHQYRYYPSSNVYKDTERGLYFYLKGDKWEVGASLPLPFREGLGESVSFELETDKPYIHHGEHVKQYPPKRSKSKKHKKWAKKK